MDIRFKTIYIGTPYECVVKDYTTDRTYGLFNSGESIGAIEEIVVLMNELNKKINYADKLIEDLGSSTMKREWGEILND